MVGTSGCKMGWLVFCGLLVCIWLLVIRERGLRSKDPTRGMTRRELSKYMYDKYMEEHDGERPDPPPGPPPLKEESE